MEQGEAQLWLVEVRIIKGSSECGGMCLKMFWQISMISSLMEELGIFDSLSDSDLWCLQITFIRYINYRLHEWSAAWLRHPSSSANNTHTCSTLDQSFTEFYRKRYRTGSSK